MLNAGRSNLLLGSILICDIDKNLQGPNVYLWTKVFVHLLMWQSWCTKKQTNRYFCGYSNRIFTISFYTR